MSDRSTENFWIGLLTGMALGAAVMMMAIFAQVDWKSEQEKQFCKSEGQQP